ncbi:MAG: hypothetical protein HOH14_03260 [Gammaproteobacteria bacterium]|nr:hypothetical protein [Gammaproteobacteria bacterium]
MLNTLFFYASKIIWALLSPATLIYLLLMLGIALVYFRKIDLAKILLGTAAVLLTLVAILPLGLWLASPLENRFPANPQLPDNIHGIILLGGAIDPLNPLSGTSQNLVTQRIAISLSLNWQKIIPMLN